MTRRGKTEVEATNRVKAAALEAAQQASVLNSARHSGDTRLRSIAEDWLAELKRDTEMGLKSPRTLVSYKSSLFHVVKHIGDLSMSEVTPPVCNALMQHLREQGMKYDLWSTVRAVLSNICSYAVRSGAIESNPVHDLKKIVRTEEERKPVRALTFEQRNEILLGLAGDEEAVRLDLPDLFEALFATGVRISEILACAGDDVIVPEAPESSERLALRLDYRLSLTEEGLRRVRRQVGARKGGPQVLLLPSWSADLFLRRKAAAGPNRPLFPNPIRGGWRSPSGYTNTVIAAAMTRLGYDWVRSHVARRTVATAGDQAGLDMRDIAVQVGHRGGSPITERSYVERRAANTAMVEVLDGLAPQSVANVANLRSTG